MFISDSMDRERYRNVAGNDPHGIDQDMDALQRVPSSEKYEAKSWSWRAPVFRGAGYLFDKPGFDSLSAQYKLTCWYAVEGQCFEQPIRNCHDAIRIGLHALKLVSTA